jgi:hypothetical protein
MEMTKTGPGVLGIELPKLLKRNIGGMKMKRRTGKIVHYTWRWDGQHKAETKLGLGRVRKVL